MLQLLPIPSWDVSHPLVIHFPIVLLLLAPFFVLLGLLTQTIKRRTFLTSALLLMILGTVSLYLAVGTGRAAGAGIGRTVQINAILEYHRTLATETAITFSVVTVTFALMLFITRFYEVKMTELTPLPLAFVLFYAIGLVLLIITAHNGSRLVHEFGVNAVLMPMPGAF